MSDRFEPDPIKQSERLYLDQQRRERRSAVRRTALMILLPVLLVIFGLWIWDTRGRGGQAATTTTTTAEQRVKADGQQALADWGRFGVTGNPDTLKDSFWTEGPQYKLLAKEAAKHPKPIGPPAYTVTMTDVQVKPVDARADERVLRSKVTFTRPGETPQAFNWDVWMRRDDAAGGRWRLWTVRDTGAR